MDMAMALEFSSSDLTSWKDAHATYASRVEALEKPGLVSLDKFYRTQLPDLLHQRDPNPYVTVSELTKLMQWKLSRGKWRPRFLDFVSFLNESDVESASRKAFQCLPDISNAVSDLTVLKGIGPATASAVLEAYAPDVAPFISDEGMQAALGNAKDYSLKQYLSFTNKLQRKATELSTGEENFTPSDVERALWSSMHLAASQAHSDSKSRKSSSKGKRKR